MQIIHLVIVLETSKTKQIISNEIICQILHLLNESDKFYLVLTCNDIASIRQQNTNMEPDGDFDEGYMYNATLGQLQQLFDVQVMQSAYEIKMQMMIQKIKLKIELY